MFPIMTEEQMARADEMTLRQRVRELSGIVSKLTANQQTLEEIRNILLTIAINTRKPPPRAAKKRKRHVRRA
jgi:hypothetical protein